VSTGPDHRAELAARGPTFDTLGDEWLDGVERARIGRRRGRGKPYSKTTIASMRRRWQYTVRPEFGDRVAVELTEMDCQRWIDQLAREGLSRSLIAQLVSLASGIYAWAAAPSRRLVERNPPRLAERPPNDEKPRMRVALAPEVAALLAALEPSDRVPYAIAFYAGLRRSEIYRLEWPEVLDADKIATRVLVMRSKSDAGTHRRPPIADNLRTILADAWERQGRPREGKVVDRSVMSGKIATRAEAAWTAAALNRITLHECRHTSASSLMAAGYTDQGADGVHGHADLQMVNRYVKLLPQPGEDDAAARLNDYLRRSQDSVESNVEYPIVYTIRMAKTVPAREFRARLSELLSDVADRRDHVLVTRNGRPAAALVPIDEYEALEETAEILSDPDAVAAIEAGLAEINTGEVVELDDLRRELAERRPSR
jgi:prevent-host-death family protein